MTEFAPGIPDKETSHELRAVEKPEPWEYVLTRARRALRRGKHYDLRLGDPKTGHGHSWALAPGLAQAGPVHLGDPAADPHDPVFRLSRDV